MCSKMYRYAVFILSLQGAVFYCVFPTNPPLSVCCVGCKLPHNPSTSTSCFDGSRNRMILWTPDLGGVTCVGRGSARAVCVTLPLGATQYSSPSNVHPELRIVHARSFKFPIDGSPGHHVVTGHLPLVLVLVMGWEPSFDRCINEHLPCVLLIFTILEFAHTMQ